MVTALLIAGIAMVSGGILAIGLGIPVNEFSFGNTLIFSGTVVACTGIMMCALWTVVHELRRFAKQVSASGLRPYHPGEAGSNSDDSGLRLGRDLQALERRDALGPSGPQPWHDDALPRDRERPSMPAAPDFGEVAPAEMQRRNLPFSSASRKERERGAARRTDFSGAEPRAAPPPDLTPDPEPGGALPASYDDAWPKSERSQPRRGGRTSTRFADSGSQDYPSAPSRNDRAAVTVLKSGVVDGMAYSLYSDGSIEAQMPEGMMRFASIDELRTHLDLRS